MDQSAGRLLTFSEATLARKTSAKKRSLPPQVVEGKVHKRAKEESHPSNADVDESSLSEENGERVSPAVDRAADAIVQRAAQSLIRLESKRRLHTFVRKFIIITVVFAVIASLGYYFAEDLPTDLLESYWEQLQTKLAPLFSES